MAIIGSMTGITPILNAIEQSDSNAAGRFVPLVCGELRKLPAAKDWRIKDLADWNATPLLVIMRNGSA